jgi:uncharacterized membrane protein YphA (DoxX/SURF4 family)
VNLSKQRLLDSFTILARLMLGALFIYMGLVKAMDPVQFLKMVHEYEMVRSPFLLNAVAAALPWFEVFCGVMLLVGIAVRGTALLLIAMLIPFTVLVTKRALAIASAKSLAFCAVKFNCGCGNGEVFICHKILENTGLLLLAAWLLAGYGRQFALRFCLWKQARLSATS